MNVEQILARSSTQARKEHSSSTCFKYMESAIVKTLKQSSHLLYIEVPNEALLKRVEKGVKQIF